MTTKKVLMNVVFKTEEDRTNMFFSKLFRYHIFIVHNINILLQQVLFVKSLKCPFYPVNFN